MKFLKKYNIIWCFHSWRVLLEITNPLFMIIRICPPIYTYSPIHFRKIVKKFWMFLQIPSPLLFRGEDDAMQVQYTVQVATDFV